MPLPSFTIAQTTTFHEILGKVAASELVATNLSNVRVRFESNVPETHFVLWSGDMHHIKPVEAYINSSGAIERVDPDTGVVGAVQLVANDASLNVAGIQWSAVFYSGTKTITTLTFTAPADNATYDMANATQAALTEPRLLSAPLLSVVKDTGGRDALTIVAGSGTIVNTVSVAGAAAGAAPILSVAGEANVDLTVQGKGTGRVLLPAATLTAPRVNQLNDTAGVAALSITPRTGATNRWNIDVNAVAGEVHLAAEGGATVAAIVKSKGLGSVILRDGSNTRLATFNTVASAVNRIDFGNAITGNNPYLQAVGDANASLSIFPSGTGRVTVVSLSTSSPRITNGINDSNGAVQLSFSSVASAVNYLRVQNSAAGNMVALFTEGQDANIGSYFRVKGTGQFVVATDAWQPVLIATPAASTVNYLNITSAATTVSPSIGAVGTDANIGINITPKGTSRVTITQLTATSAVLTTPRISSLHDATNGLLAWNFQTSATAVNYPYSVASATGVPCTISAWGTDTDIGLTIQPRGTARVTLINLSASSPRFNNIADTNGFVALTINATASAVNSMFLVPGGAGASVSFRAIGSDTDIAAGYFSKGVGQIQLRSDSQGYAFVAQPVTSGVNYAGVNAGAAGVAPQLYVTGTDTNVSMQFVTKGSGTYQFWANAGQNSSIVAVGADANVTLALTSKASGNIVLTASSSTLTINAAGATVIRRDNTAAGVIAQVTSTGLTASTGNQQVLSISPTVNQTGDAGYYMLAVNPTETAVGTGAKYLIWAGIAGVRKFVVDNAGVVSFTAFTTAGRPAANLFTAGSMIWNSTTKKPNYSDGTSWYDAAGVAA